MDGFIRFLHKLSTGKVIVVLLVLTTAVYLTMLFYSIPVVSEFAPESPIFDLSPSGYSFAYASELLGALGTEGRERYLSTQLPLDFIYPGLFAITYAFLLVWLFGKTFTESSKVYYFALIPVLAGLFDYVENVFIIKMIHSFPELQVTTVKTASTFTILKSSFTMLFFVLLIAGFALFCKTKLIKTSNRPGLKRDL